MLLKPLITEKSTAFTEKNCYTFLVDKHAGKNDIRVAVAQTFGVTVKGIRTAVVRGGQARVGKLRKKVQKSDFKKAIVKLGEKDRISLFESKDNKQQTTKKKK